MNPHPKYCARHVISINTYRVPPDKQSTKKEVLSPHKVEFIFKFMRYMYLIGLNASNVHRFPSPLNRQAIIILTYGILPINRINITLHCATHPAWVTDDKKERMFLVN